MKKLWLVMLVACVVAAFAACNETVDEEKLVNPMTEVSVPATAAIGAKMVIKGVGFDSSAQIALKDSKNVETLVEELAVTAKDAEFTVPATLAAGVYTAVLKQKGTWNLGSVRLTAPDMPLLSLSLPEKIKLNEKMMIDGIGFTSAMKLFLESADASKTRTELTVTLGASGAECSIPNGIAAGSYNVVLKLHDYEWGIGGPIEAAKYKKLVGATHIMENNTDISDFDALVAAATPENPIHMYISAFGADVIKGMLTGNNGKSTTAKSYVFNSENQLTSIAIGSGEAKKSMYSFTHSGNVMSGVNDQYDPEYPSLKSFTMTMSDGKVEANTEITGSSTGADRDRSYTWKYNKGFFMGWDASPSGNEYKAFAREEGNLVGSSNEGQVTKVVKYDAQSKKNNIFAADVALYLMGDTTIEIEIANVLGLLGMKTNLLPVSRIGADASGEKDNVLTYTFDADGYVTSISYGDQGVDGIVQLFPLSSTTKYEFVYE